MVDDDVLMDLQERRDDIRQWLQTAAPQTARIQAHLDAGSSEQAYWSHGYQAALDDVIRLLSDHRGSSTWGMSSH